MSKKLIVEIDLDEVSNRGEERAYSLLSFVLDDIVFQMSYWYREQGVVTYTTANDSTKNPLPEEKVLAYFRILETKDMLKTYFKTLQKEEK